MARRTPPRKVTYFEPVPPRLARNTIIESTFELGRRFRCTMRVDCGQLDPAAVIRPVPGEWHPRMPERLDEDELADWQAGRNGVYQLAALTIGARLQSPTLNASSGNGPRWHASARYYCATSGNCKICQLPASVRFTSLILNADKFVVCVVPPV
jgi:hypothetical protein